METEILLPLRSFHSAGLDMQATLPPLIQQIQQQQQQQQQQQTIVKKKL
jgi:hypothetical protein